MRLLHDVTADVKLLVCFCIADVILVRAFVTGEHSVAALNVVNVLIIRLIAFWRLLKERIAR